jgi:hypothetical protein
MEHFMIIAIASASTLLGAGFGLDRMRHQITRRRNEYRMSQALRRGLSNPDGIRPTRALPVLQWQSCGSSAH